MGFSMWWQVHGSAFRTKLCDTLRSKMRLIAKTFFHPLLLLLLFFLYYTIQTDNGMQLQQRLRL